jgi:PIN domain nuclease of toxin-antitoxin system
VTRAPVLDTHAWVWWVEHDGRLGHPVIDALDELPADARPSICDISLWEVAMLVERGRLSFGIPLSDWLAAAAHPRSVQILPVTPQIAGAVAALPSTFHRDPADRLIVATCRVLKSPLVTHDRAITRTRLVTLWKPEQSVSS